MGCRCVSKCCLVLNESYNRAERSERVKRRKQRKRGGEGEQLLLCHYLTNTARLTLDTLKPSVSTQRTPPPTPIAPSSPHPPSPPFHLPTSLPPLSHLRSTHKDVVQSQRRCIHTLQFTAASTSHSHDLLPFISLDFTKIPTRPSHLAYRPPIALPLSFTVFPAFFSPSFDGSPSQQHPRQAASTASLPLSHQFALLCSLSLPP